MINAPIDEATVVYRYMLNDRPYFYDDATINLAREVMANRPLHDLLPELYTNALAAFALAIGSQPDRRRAYFLARGIVRKHPAS